MAGAPLRNGRSARTRSSAFLLAWVWLAVIAYASLFPFGGWRWPPGLAALDMLSLPWPRYFIPFDIVSNLLAYLPFGLLVALAVLRQGGKGVRAFAAGALASAGLSYGLEVLQYLLPPRVPSLLDWVLNAGGGLLGALLALLARQTGLLRVWQGWREHWLDHGNAGAMVLLIIWPAALMFPAPMPLGLGQVVSVIRLGLQDALAEVPWAQGLALALSSGPGSLATAAGTIGVSSQFAAVLLGMLSPCLLAFAAARPGWRRVWLVLGALTVGLLATTLSTLLNFGPDHALAWMSEPTLWALSIGTLTMMAMLWCGQRLAAGLGLMALAGLAVLVNLAPSDPYFAQSLKAWEQGRFIRLHGVTQWVGWLWPYMAMAWLLLRLARPSRADHMP